MTISAKVICDSLSPSGVRLTTMELNYHRFIHSEFMTHRMFSRNASSSRAIPIEKMITSVESSPAIPIYWGKNQPGMQAKEEISGTVNRYMETEDGIEDLTNLIRMKLSCRNAENLLLSDEVLASLSTDWDSLKNKIQARLSVNGKHTHYPMMKKFQDGGFDRKHFNIKEIRNDLVGIMASSRPW